MAIADKAEFIRRVFSQYGVLVNFDGDAPEKLVRKLPPEKRETFGQFCERVLQRTPAEVDVLQEGSPAPQTKIARLEVVGARKVLNRALKPSGTDSGEAVVTKARPAKPSETELAAVKHAKVLERRLKKLEAQVLVAEAAAAKARASRQGLIVSARSVDQLVDNLNTYLSSKAPVDELVAAKVKAALKMIVEDKPLCDAVWKLVEMTDLTLASKRKAEGELEVLQGTLAKQARSQEAAAFGSEGADQGPEPIEVPTRKAA
jgi:hypothetical protein